MPISFVLQKNAAWQINKGTFYESLQVPVPFTLWLGFSLSLQAQTDYVFRHLDVSLGFPENQIMSVFYLPDGRLGIRTTASLTFYDGGKCDNYVYTPHSVYNWNYSGACCECIDGNGLIWMKNVGTLSVFDLHSLSYINNVDSLFRAMHVTEPVSDLYVDDNRCFWMVTDSQRFLLYSRHRPSCGSLRFR